MKTKVLLCSLIVSLALTGCSLLNFPNNNEKTSSNSSSNKQSNSNSISSSGNSSPNSASSEDEEPSVINSISTNKRVLDLVKNKYEYLSIVFDPDGDTLDSSYKEGAWSSSDESIATVSQYGKVTGIKSGQAVITFTTTKEVHYASCTVYVYDSASEIVREYQKVTDADSIQNGDIIVFGCPELGVAASINQYSGYILPASATFSGDKMTNWDADVAEFFVGEGKNDGLTLENQENMYLNGKTNDFKNGLTYLKNTKGQVNWIFEIPGGYTDIYCVNNDIAEDLCLMFNKISDSDIRFNLYNSNPTALMKMPTIYRWTVVR